MPNNAVKEIVKADLVSHEFHVEQNRPDGIRDSGQGFKLRRDKGPWDKNISG